jgi:hypothetical protein
MKGKFLKKFDLRVKENKTKNTKDERENQTQIKK